MKRISELETLMPGDVVQIEYGISSWMPTYLRAVQLGYIDKKLEEKPNIKLLRYYFGKSGKDEILTFEVEVLESPKISEQAQEAGIVAGVIAVSIAAVGIMVWLSLREIRLKSTVDATVAQTPGGQIATATKGVAGLGLVALLALGAFIYLKKG